MVFHVRAPRTKASRRRDVGPGHCEDRVRVPGWVCLLWSDLLRPLSGTMWVAKSSVEALGEEEVRSLVAVETCGLGGSL